MANLILCHHEQDEAIAEQLSDALGAHAHHVVLDPHPVKQALWDGGWTSLSPVADLVLVLLTDNFCRYLNEPAETIGYNSVQNRIAQHDSGVPILPLVTDKVDFPEVFVGNSALLLPGESPEFLAQKVHEYSSHLLAQRHRGFLGRVKYVSILLLALSMLFFVLMQIDSLIDYYVITSPLFMMAVGALAATSHLMFNVTGMLVEEKFEIGKDEENYLRIVLGAIMGWLSYVILINTEYANQSNILAIAMVTAFLVGFSSKLVIAIINQGIAMVERGLGLSKDEQRPATRSTRT
jgi:hypothetical protein